MEEGSCLRLAGRTVRLWAMCVSQLKHSSLFRLLCVRRIFLGFSRRIGDQIECWQENSAMAGMFLREM